MSDWKPGDVAMLEVQRGGGRIGLRDINNEGWRTVAGYMSDATCPPGAVHRPLVVIDPESAGDVQRLLGALLAADEKLPGCLDEWEVVQNALREFAAPTPPRPDEPQGLGAVVEDANRERWVRVQNVSHLAWAPFGNVANIKKWRSWADLDVRTEPLSEGVTP